MRIAFNQIFRENNGQLTPRQHIKIGSVQMGPGISFGPGVSFGGINIFDFKDYDIEVENHKGYMEIMGFYKNE